MQDLKAKVLEFASIAKECPDNLQEKCFELLLADFLSQQTVEPKKGKQKIDTQNQEEEKQKEFEGKVVESKQEDIQEKDLHVKVKQLLKKETLTIEQINQVFYKENGDLKPLYDDLKTTKAAESQIRIALLTALKNAINTGDFQFNGEDVRKETMVRKCYDAKNYSTNFKNNKAFFDNLESYDKNSPVVTLSTEGKTKLAEIVKDLQ